MSAHVDSVYVRFVPETASLELARTFSSQSRYISMGLRLADDTEVRTPQGRSLNGCSWRLNISDTPVFNERASENKSIGVLAHYLPAEDEFHNTPELCVCNISLGLETFPHLLQAIEANRSRISIVLQILGLSPGWEPDGSGIEWNVETLRSTLIVDIAFSLALFGDIC